MKKNTQLNSFEDFCPRCLFYETSLGACNKIHENVLSYPKRFLNKCNGKYYKDDPDKQIEYEQEIEDYVESTTEVLIEDEGMTGYEFCEKCRHYNFSMAKGILCGITNEKPSFVDKCKDFTLDPIREKKLEDAAKRSERLHQYDEENEGFFAPEKKGIQKGVLGGIAMMGIAVIWFVGGYAAGYIFFYPPILFLIGLYSFFKGMITGNVSGKK